MGQKVNPNGLRLGINKTWSSRWYSKKNYAKLLHEDLEINKYVKEKLFSAFEAADNTVFATVRA